MLTLLGDASNKIGCCILSSMKSLPDLIQMVFFRGSPKCLYIGVPASTGTKWHASTGQELHNYLLRPPLPDTNGWIAQLHLC